MSLIFNIILVLYFIMFNFILILDSLSFKLEDVLSLVFRDILVSGSISSLLPQLLNVGKIWSLRGKGRVCGALMTREGLDLMN